MKWSPISEADVWKLVNDSWDRMSFEQRHLWEAIKICPEKWTQHPWGDEGNGFWVVGIIGNTIVWYNDIEDGFNASEYEAHGEFTDYWCNQDELGWCVQNLLDRIKSGQPTVGKAGPPQAIDE